jgi:hypothetical protein
MRDELLADIAIRAAGGQVRRGTAISDPRKWT